MAVYTLKKKAKTGELHLFEGTLQDSPPPKCLSAAKSVCREMTYEESSGNAFSCEDEATARAKCAAAGRAVCGTCVSHLYTTY
jgi:hypothetical protein